MGLLPLEVLEPVAAYFRALSEPSRLRMLNLRKGFADALRRHSNSDRFDFIAEHRGMFSRLGITEAQVDRLREEHGIYMVGDSRFNVESPEEVRKTVAHGIDHHARHQRGRHEARRMRRTSRRSGDSGPDRLHRPLRCHTRNTRLPRDRPGRRVVCERSCCSP